jgi:hypothetical protein
LFTVNTVSSLRYAVVLFNTHCLNYSPADPLCNSRIDCVSNSRASLQPIGNPIKLSLNSGLIFLPTYTPSRFAFALAFEPPQLSRSLARGVGHNEHSLSHVWGTKSTARKHSPFRIVPDSGQVSENSVHPPNKEPCRVFHDDESRSNLTNDPAELSPQSASRPVNSDLWPGDTNVLAREPAGNAVNRELLTPIRTEPR